MPLGIDDVEAGDAGKLAGDRHEEHERAEPGDARARGAWGEQDAGRHRQRRRRQHDPRGAETIEQRDEDQAARRRADEIGRVDRVDLRRQPRDRQRHDQAAGEERQRGERVNREHQDEVSCE
jgi:hypothetical protein